MSPLDTIYGSVMVGLSAAGVVVLVVLGVYRSRQQDRARRRAAAMAAHPAGSLYEASAYQPATDLCHVEGCGQPYRYDVHGWRLCTDCRDELEAGWEREQLPFDQEAKELVDEAEAFLRTEGGAA